MKKQIGFTLIELMIVLIIIGALMAYAIPSYTRYVIVSKRNEAKSAIMEIAAAQEKNNVVNNVYTAALGDLGLASADFTNSHNFTFSITVDALTNVYTITATAKNQQLDDTIYDGDCTSMTLDSIGTKSPLSCWQN